jgi:F0F1-type ATP synthase membrane subunit c/vacuolar-type H+-ATPase subunit K
MRMNIRSTVISVSLVLGIGIAGSAIAQGMMDDPITA